MVKNSGRIYLLGKRVRAGRVSLGRLPNGTCDLGRLDISGIAAPGHLHLFECARRSREWQAV